MSKSCNTHRMAPYCLLALASASVWTLPVLAAPGVTIMSGTGSTVDTSSPAPVVGKGAINSPGMGINAVPAKVLALEVGKGAMLTLPAPAASVFVVDPAIADVQAPTARNLFVLGKKWGTTTVYVMAADGRTILERAVQVGPALDSLREVLRTRFPSMPVRMDVTDGAIILTGSAPTASDADAVVQAVKQYANNTTSVVNRMTVSQSQQIQLRVRITEVDRNVTQQLGINWNAFGTAAGKFIGGVYNGRSIYDYSQTVTGQAAGTYPITIQSGNVYSFLGGFKVGNTDIEGVLDALNQEGLISVLAEPNLVALSGQTASFLAGGEYPVPVSETNGAIGVSFKQYGVKLDFTPTVLNDGRISLKVRPEVSQIDSTVSVTSNSITIPGLSVRRADTTVELASGQSFAIAGLLQAMSSDTVSQVPGLGSIPIIGKLFTSKKYTNNKTELVITVTPYLAKPTDPGQLRNPLDSLTGIRNDAEYSMGRASGASPDDNAPRLRGSAGYVY